MITAEMNNGILKDKNVGIQVSLIWSCCPSTFSAAVGPRVESEAGALASPNYEKLFQIFHFCYRFVTSIDFSINLC